MEPSRNIMGALLSRYRTLRNVAWRYGSVTGRYGTLWKRCGRPSWICFPRYCTTVDAYLVVFTATQNLVGIHAVVSMIWTFEYFGCLAWKCLFTPRSNGDDKSPKPPLSFPWCT